jgi:uncharacterized protein (DUF362 family)
MDPFVVSIVRYREPLSSVREAVELCRGLNRLPSRARVFIKPNIVFWVDGGGFPKWGVVTTSRVVEDMVVLLKEHGVEKITLGEGIVSGERSIPAQAFRSLGYEHLMQRYGVELLDIHQNPFEQVDLGEGVSFRFNTDILQSDFIVNLPVLKTHSQTIVSLGIKNLKGTIDISSRKKCHAAPSEEAFHFMISRLADKMVPVFTLIDGIYSMERGPGYDGRPRRSNLLIGSQDILSADMVGARLLGHDPARVPYLAFAALNRKRTPNLSDVKTVGEVLEEVASFHENRFLFNEEATLPLPLSKMGIQGLSFRKYDYSVCTYCSLISSPILTAIAKAWKGSPWEGVEILTGKMMHPSEEMKKTILLGKCMVRAHKDNPCIERMIAVKGCPPRMKEIADALHLAGIPVERSFLEEPNRFPAMLLSRLQGQADFDEEFYRIEK